jgi:hypothetical protein
MLEVVVVVMVEQGNAGIGNHHTVSLGLVVES